MTLALAPFWYVVYALMAERAASIAVDAKQIIP